MNAKDMGRATEGCTVRQSRRLWTWIAVVALLALVAAACGQGTTTETTTTAAPAATTTTAAPAATTTTAATPSATGFTYKLGVFEDITTDNFWAYMDPEASVWNAYLL